VRENLGSEIHFAKVKPKTLNKPQKKYWAIPQQAMGMTGSRRRKCVLFSFGVGLREKLGLFLNFSI